MNTPALVRAYALVLACTQRALEACAERDIGIAAHEIHRALAMVEAKHLDPKAAATRLERVIADAR